MGNIGIEWVNKYHGRAGELSNNDDNAKGFYNTLSGVRQFNWGNDSAWDQDFEHSGVGSPTAGTDTTWIDNVDIAFFSGHGSKSGIMFGVTGFDDGWARPSEWRLGDLDLEWISFDACQVLNWDSGKVFSRCGWPCFKGLHIMLGFHTNCHDSSSRGKKYAKHLNSGWTVREAWIKACQETEGNDTQWAYLRADDGNSDTFHDHWWGKGSVSSDPDNPTVLYYARGNC